MRLALLPIPIAILAACAPAEPPSPVSAPPVATAAPSVAPAPSGPPAAPVRPVRDVYFGKEVIDPYRWMESDSPEFAGWMKAEADHTRRTIDGLDTRAAFLDRLRSLDNAGPQVRAISVRRDLVFSLEADPGSDAYKLYVREGLSGPRRLLLDPEALKTSDQSVSIDYWSVSPDARHVAFGLSRAGSEMSSIHVVEIETGKLLADDIDRARYANPRWLDDRSFFYKRDRKLPPDAPATERFIRSRVYLHTLGQDPEKDEVVFGHGVSPAIAVPDDAFPWVNASAKSPYLIAALYHGVRDEMTLYYAPRKSYAGAKTPWKKLADIDDAVTDFDVRGDDVYLLSLKNGGRARVVRTSLRRPDLDHAAALIPESDAVITSIGLGEDALYARALDAGIGRVIRAPLRAGKPETLPLGVGGSASGFATDETWKGALVKVESWTASPRVVAFDPAQKAAAPTEIIPPSPVLFKDIVSEEVKAKSADGTLVPLSIIHRRDLPRDGGNPTYLKGYGSYGNIASPAFDPTDLAWLERGGVLAVCHPRGGGEYGEAWHSGGKLATKPNTILDFIGCAEHLVREKYTSPQHLAGAGTSAGGILIGGAVVRRPDLFAAAVIRVGMVNALRFEQIPIGPFNTSEFGTVATKEGFDMLWAIDAYHQVEQGKAYPAVLLTTGITDPRVSPWQMAKMAARLQAATGSGNPVLLRVDYGSGHGFGTAKSKREEELADTYSFLTWRIGKR